MLRNRLAASFAVAVLAVLCLAGPAPAGDQVPFKGRLGGDVTVTPLAPTLLLVDVEATGNAAHLGKFTLDIPHLVIPGHGPVPGTAIGTYVFTAANGDKVYAEFNGIATPTATPGVVYIVETATITGGTGRFAGATGSFVAERLYDRIAGTTIGSFDGTISSH